MIGKSSADDIRIAEFGWPVGVARVFFCAQGDSMVLLHGFLKKRQKTPERELDLPENA